MENVRKYFNDLINNLDKKNNIDCDCDYTNTEKFVDKVINKLFTLQANDREAYLRIISEEIEHNSRYIPGSFIGKYNVRAYHHFGIGGLYKRWAINKLNTLTNDTHNIITSEDVDIIEDSVCNIEEALDYKLFIVDIINEVVTQYLWKNEDEYFIEKVAKEIQEIEKSDLFDYEDYLGQTRIEVERIKQLIKEDYWNNPIKNIVDVVLAEKVLEVIAINDYMQINVKDKTFDYIINKLFIEVGSLKNQLISMLLKIDRKLAMIIDEQSIETLEVKEKIDKNNHPINYEQFNSSLKQNQIGILFHLLREERVIQNGKGDNKATDSKIAEAIQYLCGGSAKSIRKYLGGKYVAEMNTTLNRQEANEIISILDNIKEKIDKEIIK